MRIGLIGGGGISDTHGRAASAIPGVEIVAVFGRNRDKVARLAREHGATPYDELDRFLAHRPMDLVAIGSPSGLHAEQGIAAAARGLHVLVEKPIDITTGRADDLIAAAGRAGVTLAVIFQDRLRPDVVRMKELMTSGALGTPILASGRVKWFRPASYYGDSHWRGTLSLDGGGALINQAIHTVDLLLWLFGPITRVQGRIATRLHDIEAEDTAVAVFEFASGALGTFEAATSVYPGYARRLELTGSNGTTILEHDRLVSVDLREGAAPPASAPREELENASSPVVSDASAHRRIFEDFIRAIETGTSPICDGPDGRRSLEVVQAVYESARKGQLIRL